MVHGFVMQVNNDPKELATASRELTEEERWKTGGAIAEPWLERNKTRFAFWRENSATKDQRAKRKQNKPGLKPWRKPWFWKHQETCALHAKTWGYC